MRVADLPSLTKPNPDFPIDGVVQELVSGKWAGRGWQLSPDFKGDPYLTVHCFLGRAVEIGTNADRKEEARRAHAPQVLLADIAEVETAVRVVLNFNLAERLAVITPRTESIDTERESPVYKFTGPIDEAKPWLFKAVANCESARRVVVARASAKQRGAKTFLTAFAEEMIYAWICLTARIPGPAEKLFHRFVAEAFKTLQLTNAAALCLPFYVQPWDQTWMGIKQEEIRGKKSGWAHQIRGALREMSRRSSTDRADRYAKGYQPDGVGVQPLPERARRNFADGILVVDDQETRRLIAVMNGGGDEGRGAASVLWTEYELGSEQRRRQYDEVDFNPAEAIALLVHSKPSGLSPIFGRIAFEGGPTWYFTAEDHRLFGPSFAPDDDWGHTDIAHSPIQRK